MSGSVAVVTLTIPPRAELLARAVASVVAQTRLPDEHLILCDHRGEGQVALRNRALRMVQTDWIAFLDDDDQLLPRHLEALLEHAEATRADLVYPGYEIEDGDDVLGMFGHPFDPQRLKRGNFIPITHLCRADLVRRVGGFPRCPQEWTDEGTADWGLLLRLLKAGATFSHLAERTWIWNLHHPSTRGISWRAAS